LKVGVAGSALTRWTFRAIGDTYITRKKIVSGGIREAIRKLLAHLVTYSDPQVTTIEAGT